MIYREGATEAPFSSDARKRAARMAQQAAQQANLSTSATQSAVAAGSASSFESALRANDPNVPSSAVPAAIGYWQSYPILNSTAALASPSWA